MHALNLKVRLIFDQPPTDIQAIEQNLYDVIHHAFMEGQITDDRDVELATLLEIDLVEAII